MPQGFVLCSHFRVLGSKHLRQQLHDLQPFIVIVTLQKKEKRKEGEPSLHYLSMLRRDILSALAEIYLVTINSDRSTQQRQPEAKSQSDEVGRGKGG